MEEWKGSSEVKKLSAQKLISCELNSEIATKDNLYIEAEIMLADGTVLYDTEPVLPYKHMNLPKPQLTTDVRELEEYFEITIESDVFAPFVEMDFEEADVIFSDNFFTISNEKPVVIKLDKKDIMQGSFVNAEDLKKHLIITTVADTFE